MTKDDMRDFLSGFLPKRTERLDEPTGEEWAVLEQRLSVAFPQDFRSFVELMSEFEFPGDIYNVPSSGRTNGNDSIAEVYDIERSSGDWPPELIPFYGIGNGDYFAISRKDAAVYYHYHEDGHIELQHGSFLEWVRGLPAFLNE